MNRLDYLTSRDERAEAASAAPRVTVADALADTTAVLLRIRYCRDRNGRPYHRLDAYTAGFREIRFDELNAANDALRRTALIAYVRGTYPDVDWTRDWDVDLTTRCVHRAPDAWETGALPEEDGCFRSAVAVTA